MPPLPPSKALPTLLTAVRYVSTSSRAPFVTTSSPWASSSRASSTKAKPIAPAAPAPVPASTPASTKGKDKNGSSSSAIPPLPRPLGVSFQPTSNSKSWAQRKTELLDEERHKAKRKALVKEATQGYFHDYNRARAVGGGKLWMAPSVLIREDKALYFPDIPGKSLLSENVHTTDLLRGKTTLISLISTRISEEHVQSLVQPTLDDVDGHPDFSYITINHQRNPLKSMLLSLLTSSLKRTIPKDRWGKYLISGGEWSEIDINQPLGLENKLLGYVFLIDPLGKIRWAACGAATNDEVQSLRRATAVLLGRMRGSDTAS